MYSVRGLFVTLLLILNLTKVTPLGWLQSIGVDDRIVGGVDADPGEIPYQTSLRINNRHFCGGSIISNRAILTAAHCLIGCEYNSKKNASSVAAVVGTNQLNNSGQSYQAEKLRIHPEYNRWRTRNDIALVILSVEIDLNDNVKIIKLSGFFIEADQTVVASGWGFTSYPGGLSNDLKKIKLKTISHELCQKSWNFLTMDQLCTLTKEGEGTCFGDSGGPLVANDELAGIVSFGRGCAVGIPDVFTRVSSYIHWIIKSLV